MMLFLFFNTQQIKDIPDGYLNRGIDIDLAWGSPEHPIGKYCW